MISERIMSIISISGVSRGKIIHTVLSIFLLLTAAFATEFRVDKEAENIVRFISQAPLEDITGVTDKIDGYILWDKNDMTAKSEFYFEVDLASIDTGIGLRNRHLRENYLETDEYQFVSYGGKIIKAVKSDSNIIDIVTSGTFKLHGVERNVQIDGKLYKLENGYRASSQFSIKLQDYKIERPQLMLLKIGEVIQLDVNFYAKEYLE